MKSKLAFKFIFNVTRESNNSIAKISSGSIKCTPDAMFYIKLGQEITLADLASIIGANNKLPETCNRFYIHSEKYVKV